MKKSILHIKNASLSFGQGNLFSNFNLELYSGELVSIIGESGRGKTSLLNALVGFVPLTQGRIIVDSLELSKQTIDAIRKRVAWIPQELFIPTEWVSDMVQIPFKLKANRSTHFSERKLIGYFDELGLESDLLERRVTEISGGQRQRIMVAVSVLLEKPLLILDEPTSALDAGSALKVASFLTRKKQELDMAILAVSHDKTFASCCDRQIRL